VLGCDRLHLYLRFEEALQAAEVDAYRALVLRRGEREPLQYLLGRVGFLGLELAVDRRAFIPRPETEELARLLRTRLRLAGLRAADIGTGTGCLALSLAQAGAEVLATDLSPEALALAGENAAALGLALRFRLGDGLAPLEGEAPWGLIVSNPPYIAETEAAGLQPEVARYEPALALYSGPEGLDLPRRLLAGAPEYLEAGGWLALELGLGQAARLAQEARSAGAWTAVEILKDCYNVDRYLFCRRA
jgi:release factor glutamine methyltransferase